MNTIPREARKPCLVTGASGFLGGEIVRQFAAAGFLVRGAGRRPDPNIIGAEYVNCDVLLPQSIRPAMQDVDVIVHAAGLAHQFRENDNPGHAFRQVNRVGSANVARAAVEAGAGKFVLISSVAVYGPHANGYDEFATCRPETPYARSKLDSEQEVTAILANSGVSLTILRLATVYGEGDRGNLSRLIRAIHRNRFIQVGSGLNRKTLVYKQDAAQACLLAAQDFNREPNLFNISGASHTMREIVHEVFAALGKTPPRFTVPGWPAVAGAGLLGRLCFFLPQARRLPSTLDKWLSEDVYNDRRFKSAFDFSVQIPLAEGVGRQVRCYLEEVAGHASPELRPCLR